MERLPAPADCVSDRRRPISKRRNAAKDILADLDKGFLPGERK